MAKVESANVTSGKTGNSKPTYLVTITTLASDVYTWAFPKTLVDGATTYDGDKITQIGQIDYSIDLSEGGGVAAVTTFDFSIANPAGGTTLYSDTLFDASKVFENATIEIRLIFANVASPTWANGLQIYKGFVETVSWDWQEIYFFCVDSWRKRHKEIPVKTLHKSTSGDLQYLPEENDGKPVPIVYGQFAVSPIHFTGVACDVDNWTVYSGYRDYIKGYMAINRQFDHYAYVFAGHTLAFPTLAARPAWDSLPRLFSGYSGDCPGGIALSNVTDGDEDTAFGDGTYYARENCMVRDRAPSIRRIVPIVRDLGCTTPADALLCVNEDETDYTTINSTNQFNTWELPITWCKELEGNKVWRLRACIKVDELHLCTDDQLQITFGQYDVDGAVIDGTYFTHLMEGTEFASADTIDLMNIWESPPTSAMKIDNDCSSFHIGINYVVVDADDGAYFLVKNLYMQMSDALYVSDKPKLPEAPKEIYACADGYNYGSWITDGGRTNPFANGECITSAPGIIEGILRNQLELTSTEIDTVAFDAEMTRLWYADSREVKLAKQILDREDSLDIIAKICYESAMGYYQDWQAKESVFRLTPIGTPVAISNTTIATQDGKYKFKIDRTPIDNLYCNFKLKYRKNPATDNYDKSLFVDHASADAWSATYSNMPTAPQTYWDKCVLCHTTYGIDKTWDYEADWIRDDDTAERFLEFMIDWLTVRHYLVDFEGFLDHIDLELGDQRKINHALLPSGINNSEHFLLVSQTINPKRERIEMRWISIGTP